MKTSYVYKNNGDAVKDDSLIRGQSEESPQEQGNSSFDSIYMDLSSKSAGGGSNDVHVNTNNMEDKYIQGIKRIGSQMQAKLGNNNGSGNQSKPKNQNKGASSSKSDNKSDKKSSKKPIIIGLSVAAVIAASVIGYKVYSTNQINTGFENLQMSIARLYTTDGKGTIISNEEELAQVYALINEYTEKGKDTSSMLAEVDTMVQYLKDTQALSALADPGYNLAAGEYLTTISSIRSNLSTVYKVSGLRGKVSSLCDEAEDAYTSYAELKLFLTNFNDVSAYTDDLLSDEISLVSHDLNRQELEAIKATIASDKAVLEAKAALDAFDTPETTVNEEGEEVPVEYTEEELATRETQRAALNEAYNNALSLQQASQLNLVDIQSQIAGTGNTALEDSGLSSESSSGSLEDDLGAGTSDIGADEEGNTVPNPAG